MCMSINDKTGKWLAHVNTQDVRDFIAEFMLEQKYPKLGYDFRMEDEDVQLFKKWRDEKERRKERGRVAR